MTNTLHNKTSLFIIGTVLGVIVLLVGVLGILIARDNSTSVENIAITNVTDTAFTVTWTSENQYTGRVVFQEGGDEASWPFIFAQLGREVAFDDRDIELAQDGTYVQTAEGLVDRYTHHVTVRNLKPETEYSFRIAGLINGKEAPVSTATTLPLIEDIQTPDPAYGKVEGADVNGDAYIVFSAGQDENNIKSISVTLSDNQTYAFDANLLTDVVNSPADATAIVYAQDNFYPGILFDTGNYKPLDDIILSPEQEGGGEDAVGQESNNLSNQLINSVFAQEERRDCTITPFNSRANIREAQNTNSKIIDQLDPGDTLVARCADNTNEDNQEWHEVSYKIQPSQGQETGYIREDTVRETYTDEGSTSPDREEGDEEPPTISEEDPTSSESPPGAPDGWEPFVGRATDLCDLYYTFNQDQRDNLFLCTETNTCVVTSTPIDGYYHSAGVHATANEVPACTSREIVDEDTQRALLEGSSDAAADVAEEEQEDDITEQPNNQEDNEDRGSAGSAVILTSEQILLNSARSANFLPCNSTEDYISRLTDSTNSSNIFVNNVNSDPTDSTIVVSVNSIREDRNASNNLIVCYYNEVNNGLLGLELGCAQGVAGNYAYTTPSFDGNDYSYVCNVETGITNSNSVTGNDETSPDLTSAGAPTTSDTEQVFRFTTTSPNISDQILSLLTDVSNTDGTCSAPKAGERCTKDDGSEFIVDNRFEDIVNTAACDYARWNGYTILFQIDGEEEDCVQNDPAPPSTPSAPPPDTSFLPNRLDNPIFAQETPATGSPGDVTEDSITVNESGLYAFFADGERVGEQEVVVGADGEATIQLFVDINGNGIRDEGEEFLDDYTQITFANEASVETFQLSAGWNLIHIPLIDTRSEGTIRTAGDLIDHWNNQGFEIRHISRYLGGEFDIVTRRESGTTYDTDFNLVPGQGLFVFNGGGALTTATFAGNRATELPIDLTNGWNLIGVVPSTGTTYTAESLINGMSGAGYNASILSQFENGIYQSVVFESGTLFGNDYNVIETRGYFVRVDEINGDPDNFTP